MSHDIDAYFAHLDKIGHERAEELQWVFSFRSTDFDHLTRIGESLEDEFQVHLQEEVETIEQDRTFMGPPLLRVELVAALTPVDLKVLHDRFGALAEDEGVDYEGFTSYEPIDEEELFGWLDLEAAIWRLRHFTDNGLEEGAPVPLVLAMAGDDEASLESVGAKLEKLGYTIDGLGPAEDEPGTYVLIARCEARNEDAVIERRYREVERTATAAGATLLGAQFFDLEEEGAEDDKGGDGEDD